jgi:hypothetical protein
MTPSTSLSTQTPSWRSGAGASRSWSRLPFLPRPPAQCDDAGQQDDCKSRGRQQPPASRTAHRGSLWAVGRLLEERQQAAFAEPVPVWWPRRAMETHVHTTVRPGRGRSPSNEESGHLGLSQVPSPRPGQGRRGRHAGPLARADGLLLRTNDSQNTSLTSWLLKRVRKDHAERS